MNIKNSGEFALIERIKNHFAFELAENMTGIGDDCAVIPIDDETSHLFTTDFLTEGVHFLRDDIDPFSLGHKALAVNLSDIAAMGGKPLYSFLTLALPLDLDSTWLDFFLLGLKTLSMHENILLLGGDTNKSLRDISINIAVIGSASPKTVKRRSTALPGDIICVSDCLGDSRAGLDIILQKLPRDREYAHLLQKHYQPRAHLQEGQWLSQRSSVHAMIDISDGLVSDLQRLAESSQCGFEIDMGMIPLSETLKNFCARYHRDAVDMAVSGGEDYSLLFTVDARYFADLRRDFTGVFGRSLYPIGHATHRAGTIEFLLDGIKVERQYAGFDHLKD